MTIMDMRRRQQTIEQALRESEAESRETERILRETERERRAAEPVLRRAGLIR